MTTAWSADAVVLPDGVRPATVWVEDGRIARVTAIEDAPAYAERLEPGLVLLPGVVDTHVHVNEPGRTEWEGFATATTAAARGGVTTLVDMPLNSVPSTTTPEALAAKRARAEGTVRVDVGFWGGAVPDNAGRREELWDAGVFGFKCFLLDSGVPEFAPLDERQLVEAAREIAAFGGLLIVHAEDAATIAAAPAPPSRAYADFVRSRPDAAEVTAIERVVDAVRETGCRTHVLHLSSARAVPVLAAAQAEGLPLTVETCPHYLVLDAGQVPDGAAAYKCCPPIRDRGNQDALWDALLDGVIGLVVSDHSPSTPAEKARGDGDLQQAWGGISGLQVGLTVMADAARDRGVGLDVLSRWMSRGPADLVGLTAKGRIEIGADADLVGYDPTAGQVLRAADLAHRHPVSAYDGRPVRGRVVRTLLRGAEPGGGRLLTRR